MHPSLEYNCQHTLQSQLLSGCMAADDCLYNKTHKLPSFVNCAAWGTGETRKDAGILCEWKHQRAPRVAMLFSDGKATNAVLFFGARRSGRQSQFRIRGGDAEGEEREKQGR